MSTIQRQRVERQLRLVPVNAAPFAPPEFIEAERCFIAAMDRWLEWKRRLHRIGQEEDPLRRARAHVLAALEELAPLAGPVRSAQRPLAQALDALDAVVQP